MTDKPKKVAIIGGGISGLGAAYALKDHCEVTLYEKNPYIGGHSRTLEVKVDDEFVSVDTGFIVYNEHNYPLLTKLFNELEVPVVHSDMSFGVSIDHGWLEYSSGGIGGLFGSVKNALNPKMWGMVGDILKFNKRALDYLNAPVSVSLGDCLNEIGVGRWFRDYYLLPMGGSIWSCPLDQMLAFPAATFIRFFENHGLLSIRDQPQWYSVLGGSREYVSRLIEALDSCLELRQGAQRIYREHDVVRVVDRDGRGVIYDEVILAVHADEALSLIDQPHREEAEILSAFKYQPNEVVLHTDVRFMPRRRSAWASWVYGSDKRVDDKKMISLSYWMNNLQSIPTDTPIIVTLNPGMEPAEGTLLDRHIFQHPVFDQSAILAQEAIMKIQGKDHLWFCGAYQRNGFHEDGLWSAVRVAKAMGVEPAWI